MKHASSGKLQIAFDEAGAGDTTLLLLPGWCASRTMWAKLVPLLAKRFHVVALDWRGHGDSDTPAGDWTSDDNVTDALAVIAASGAGRIVPVAAAHAGWVALELLARLGAERVAKVVLLDWIVLDPPPPFLGALGALQDPASYAAVRDKLFAMWLGSSGNPDVARFVHDDMARYPAALWARGSREIARAYAAHGNPLRAFSALGAGVPVLHVYSQPKDDGYLAAQRGFSAEHPWFQACRIDGETHFPSLETPEAVAGALIQA